MRSATLAGALALGLALPAAGEEWYDAYNRGLLALKQREAKGAVAGLTRAIQLRKEPGEGLLTYGTNAVRRYYPYLRLADAYLMLGDPAAARRTLRRSEEIGKEPAVERASIAVLVESSLQKKAETMTAAKLAASPAEPVPGADPELEVGLKQVQAGDFEAGAVILEGVVRRLAGQDHSSELARAYLYLGVAYIGLSQQERARAGVPATP